MVHLTNWETEKAKKKKKGRGSRSHSMLGKITSLPHGCRDRANLPMMGRKINPKPSEGKKKKQRKKMKK